MPNEKTGMQQGQQMRYTEQELSLIKTTFRGNDDLLKLMRKMFLPEYDPQAPLGQIIDLWMLESVEGKTPEQVYMNVVARNNLILHIDSRLMELRTLAGLGDETPEEALERLKKNSSK